MTDKATDTKTDDAMRKPNRTNPFEAPCAEGEHEIINVGPGLWCPKCDALKGC